MGVGEVIFLLIISIIAIVALIIAIVGVSRDISLTYKVVDIDQSTTVKPIRNTIYNITGTTAVALTFGSPSVSNVGIQVILVNNSSKAVSLAGTVSPSGGTLAPGHMALLTTIKSGEYYAGYFA